MVDLHRKRIVNVNDDAFGPTKRPRLVVRIAGAARRPVIAVDWVVALPFFWDRLMPYVDPSAKMRLAHTCRSLMARVLLEVPPPENMTLGERNLYCDVYVDPSPIVHLRYPAWTRAQVQ